jgi:hypothetical protein
MIKTFWFGLRSDYSQIKGFQLLQNVCEFYHSLRFESAAREGKIIVPSWKFQPNNQGYHYLRQKMVFLPGYKYTNKYSVLKEKFVFVVFLHPHPSPCIPYNGQVGWRHMGWGWGCGNSPPTRSHPTPAAPHPHLWSPHPLDIPRIILGHNELHWDSADLDPCILHTNILY